MMRAATAIVLLGLATSSEAREPLVRVPFVGCPADGQTGPEAAPKRGNTPRVPANAAAKLAYYSTTYAFVLAPRGWHCIGLYGSSGQALIVTPEPHKAEEFFQGAPVPIRGLAVQMNVSVGGTSGRLSVMPAIARYFPRYQSFLREIRRLDPDVGPFPTRPYKTDVIRRRTVNYLRFTTPAGKQGEGTHSLLLPGSLPIEGIRKIVGSTEEPDLVSANVRLPPNQFDLIDAILFEAAK
jgi:hypothetical protein